MFELNIEKEIEFMIKYELTPDELFLIRLIFYAQNGYDNFLKEYFSNGHLTLSLREVLVSLKQKGVINKSYIVPDIGECFNARDVDFNKLVINNFLKNSGELGREFTEHYPISCAINGQLIFLKNVDKLYNSFDELYFDYGRKIHFNPQAHEEVLELLEWGKDNGLIKEGICNFIASERWHDLQKLRDNGDGFLNTNEVL